MVPLVRDVYTATIKITITEAFIILRLRLWLSVLLRVGSFQSDAAKCPTPCDCCGSCSPTHSPSVESTASSALQIASAVSASSIIEYEYDCKGLMCFACSAGVDRIGLFPRNTQLFTHW